MEPERWQQIDKLLEAALEQEESQREAFLKEACRGDEALRQEVESLLEHQSEHFMEEPAVEMAAEGLVKDQVQALVGKQMGSYKILSLLGKGGMGEVYRARDMKLEREVAIKVLPAEFTQDPGRLARFEREAKLLAALNHPNIAAIYWWRVKHWPSGWSKAPCRSKRHWKSAARLLKGLKPLMRKASSTET